MYQNPLGDWQHVIIRSCGYQCTYVLSLAFPDCLVECGASNGCDTCFTW